MQLQLDDEQLIISQVSYALFRESMIASIGAMESVKKEYPSDSDLLNEIDEELQEAKRALVKVDEIIAQIDSHMEEEVDITKRPEWDQ